MIAPNLAQVLQLTPRQASKPRLLLVSDSVERLRTLRSAINSADFELRTACSHKELRNACHEAHDLVALDVNPSQIAATLKLIRSSEGHAEIPILVESGRIINDLSLAGVLPSYRAMPCNRTELLTLLRRHICLINQTQERHVVL
jgi:DNA-binding NtrC family response regulator